jgi:FkbM family methyltransferase
MKKLILPDDHDLCIRTFLQEIETLGGGGGGVLHVGAHVGEEVPAYRDNRYSPIFLVEANPEILPELGANFAGSDDVHIIPTAVGEARGTVEFVVHKTTKGGMESAGILPLDRLGEIVPVFNSDTRYSVPICTIDDLVAKHDLQRQVDLMVLDIQGAELKALRGATQFLGSVKHVICEVNLISNYEGCALEEEIDALFQAAGYTKKLGIYHELYDKSGRFPAWGECLWQR